MRGDFNEDEIEDFEPDDAFDDFDCHMDRHGMCGKAGSEECEFECPFRAAFEKHLSRSKSMRLPSGDRE